jgi:predicted secreted protein
MFMKSRLIGTILLFFLVATLLMAGDMANFVNLGFSPNGRYFMFAQYGVEETSTYPYADIFVVDVPGNKFFTGGVKQTHFTLTTEPGNTGIGALLMLLKDNYELIKNCNIDHLKTGRILYLLVNGTKPEDELTFRDFITEQQYSVKLFQKQQFSGENIKASFHIELAIVLKNNTTKNYQVGLPNYFREDIVQYCIRQIILAPDGASLIFFIEKDMVDKTSKGETGSKGYNIRYMVETLRLY